MKAYNYVSIGVSIIMMMMGILFLVYPFPPSTYLGENEFIRYMFAGLLIVYGIFRAYNSIMKIRQKDRKFHYYDPGESSQNDLH
ncbi:MAG TPA: DUF308 domain-containing protein [Ignavibacteria bacterium]|nr:DUF308 domain-containing protein [Ignavibacteria bacterium]